MKSDNNEGKTVKYDIALEIIKMVACFFVVFNHTQQHGYLLFTTRELGGIRYNFDLLITILCRTGVPLFFMASGAVLLKKNDSAKKLMKRAIRIIVCLVIFSFIYYCLNARTKKVTINLHDFICGLEDASVWLQSLWYLYAYLAYIASVPFIKHIALGLSDRSFLYLLGLNSFITSAVPILKYFGGVSFSSNLLLISWVTNAIIFYPVVGYYIVQNAGAFSRRMMKILNVLSLLSIGIIFLLTFFDAKKNGLSWNSTSWIGIQMPFISAVFFSNMYRAFNGIQFESRNQKLLLIVSQSTFGVYLLHPIFLLFWKPMDKIWAVINSFTAGVEMIGAFVVCTALIIVCCIIVCLLKQLPVFKKIL